VDGAAIVARLYTEAGLAAGAAVELTEGQAHYLGHVLRCEPGAHLLLFNGRDGEWQAVLAERGKRRCLALVGAQTRRQRPEPGLGLVFAPVKGDRIDWIVEKATELGASLLQPVRTRRTIVERVNLRRLQANAVEAAEQSERLTIPEVRDLARLDEVLASWPAGRPLLLCDETGGGAPLAEALGRIGREAGPADGFGPAGVAFLVGPEGGFAETELDGLRKLPFVKPVGLGPRILRAETAALAALAVAQAVIGDWRGGSPRRGPGDQRTGEGR
jgi:16S rRNA (uracil1498-N3)-methyltransferase